MVFPWCSYVFYLPMVFPWCSFGFPSFCHGFPMFSHGFSHPFPLLSQTPSSHPPLLPRQATSPPSAFRICSSIAGERTVMPMPWPWWLHGRCHQQQLWKMAIGHRYGDFPSKSDDFPMKHGDFPQLCSIARECGRLGWCNIEVSPTAEMKWTGRIQTPCIVKYLP